MLVIHIVGFLRRCRVPDVGFRCRVVGPGPVSGELRDGDGRQDTDDRDNNHQLNQCETFILPHHFRKHFLILLDFDYIFLALNLDFF
jgi:hypothetical protein